MISSKNSVFIATFALAMLTVLPSASRAQKGCGIASLTAEAKASQWRQSLEAFLGNHLDLAPEAYGLIVDAIRSVEPEHFRSSDPELLRDLVGRMDKELPRSAYIEIFGKMQDLQPWLVQTGAMSSAGGGSLPVCTCSGACSVGTCSSGCYSQPNLWGYCSVSVE